MDSKYDIKRFLITLAIGLFALWYGAGGAYAADYTWDDGGLLDSNWSTPENWSPDGIPGAGDNVIFNSTSSTDCIADVVVDNLASISLNSGYTSTLTLNSDFVGGSNELTLSGNLTVNSGTILCKGDTSTTNGEGITINAANITVASGAKVSADSQGFSASEGPGAGQTDGYGQGAGAGYGGKGGNSYYVRGGSIYGSVSAPTSLGSGGGSNVGGKGGGAIKLNVSGTLTVNGTISANGKSGSYKGGGGAGGSIWIIADTLGGLGSITADGGNGWTSLYGGGGGGGRIALYLSHHTSFLPDNTTVSGASGYRYGEDGTLVCSPVGGYTEANVILQAQCVQSTDGEGMENGIVTISFKVKDPGDEINGVSTLDLAGEIIVNDSEAAFVDGDKSWSSNTAGY